MKRAHGRWVEGEDFWDREQELEEMKEIIDEGANVLLIAQRRIGKTSLMKELSNQISDDYISLFVDLENSFIASDAIAEMTVAAPVTISPPAYTKSRFDFPFSSVTM